MKIVIFFIGVFISILGGLTYTKDLYGSFPAVFNLANLNGTNGFAINGAKPWDQSGWSVSGAGDVNGDGIADIIIGAPNEFTVGQSYIIFGSKQSWPAYIELSALNGRNGFVIRNLNAPNQNGYSVSGAGDVNGDGIADILIGDPGYGFAESYVIFGSKKLWPEEIYIKDLNGNNGFIIKNDQDAQGGDLGSVSGVGDVNADGIADILIGAPGINDSTGQSYVVFGSKEQWSGMIKLSSLDGMNGFAINGINSGDYSGIAVSGAGDINGDGIADFLIGAPDANNSAGQSYVIFGSGEPWPAKIDLANLNGNNGFIINGINSGDGSGVAVSRIGDINGDGISDILIGASSANNNAGQSYVVFGSKQPWPAYFNLNTLNGKNGFVVNGINQGDSSGLSVSGGDFNGDGIADTLIGAEGIIDQYTNIGRSFIVFGSKKLWPPAIQLVNLNGTNGFFINGVAQTDNTTISVSGAGDVNGDGIEDILIGAYDIDFGNNYDVGQSYIVFGQR